MGDEQPNHDTAKARIGAAEIGNRGYTSGRHTVDPQLVILRRATP